MEIIRDSSQLNKFYNDTVIKETETFKFLKTRLVVVKDKQGEHLEARKLTILERIKTLFGDKDVASLKRVVDYCTAKGMDSEGLSNVVNLYNNKKKHANEKISYIIHDKLIAPDQSLLRAVPDKTPPSNIQRPKSNISTAGQKTSPSQVVQEKEQPMIKANIIGLTLEQAQKQLLDACTSGDLNLVVAITEHRSELDLNKSLASLTPLINAAGAGNVDVVKHLLTLDGVTPTVSVYGKGDALQAAIENDRLDVVKALLADPRMQITPKRLVDLLSFSKNEEITQALASANSVKGPEDHNKTPLIYAAQNDAVPLETRKTIVKNLLEHGKDDILQRDNIGSDAVDLGKDVMDVFEEFAKQSHTQSAKMKMRLESKDVDKDIQTIRTIIGDTVRQLENKKAADASVWPKLEGEQVKQIKTLCKKYFLTPSRDMIISGLTQTEKKAILLNIARSSTEISQSDALSIVPALMKGLTVLDVLYPLQWLKKKLVELEGIKPTTRQVNSEIESITRLGKILMKECVTMKNYGALMTGYPKFIPQESEKK